MKQIANLSASDDYEKPTSSLARRPIDLDQIGLGWLNNMLFNMVMRPLSRLLFYETECKGNLDWRQGYVAGYSHASSEKAGPSRDHLVAHTDDSEVTFNVCLGEDFENGELVFHGLRGDPRDKKAGGIFEPTIGRAVLHAGRNLHSVNKVSSGSRYVFIIWGRSWEGVRKIVCPCCWLNRRKDNDMCICGPRWN